jgi:hypothetical protein
MTAPDSLHLVRWTVSSGSNVQSRAAVIIEGGDGSWQASATGNGAIDALLEAVDEALRPVLGGEARIVAYDVHALAEGPDAEGVVTVRVRPPDEATGERGTGEYTASARSTNIVAASVEAYVAAIAAMLGAESWSDAVEIAGAKAPKRTAPRRERAEYDRAAADAAVPDWFEG